MASKTAAEAKSDNALPEKILSAAMTILQTRGVKSLSQAKVAAEAGIRQSHLTYYFPKKADLIAGLLQQHIDGAEQRLAELSAGESFASFDNSMAELTRNQARMRFFLGLLVEADNNSELQTMLAAHIRQFDDMVACHFGRPSGDENVVAFLNTLRGFGMCNLVASESGKGPDIDQLIKTFGLDNKTSPR